MYHRERYRSEDVDITIKNAVNHGDITVITAEVTHDEYGTIEVSRGFRNEKNWGDMLNGRKKYECKLKDMALDELQSSSLNRQTNDEKEGKDTIPF